MEAVYRFSQMEMNQITNRFGGDYYNKLVQDTVSYAGKWQLTHFQLVPSYSANIVFMCISQQYGHAVLKVGTPTSGGIDNEYNTLLQYEGRGFCEVFEADIVNSVLLEKRVMPGVVLREEQSLDRRVSQFCSLYDGLHIAPADSRIFPTYVGWVERIASYMSKREDCKALRAHMAKAQQICYSIASRYTRNLLLHGDFHHDNILLDEGGRYTIIDPKGVVGDPVFDIPRFILNEFDDEITPGLSGKISTIINQLEARLNIPNAILKQCLYVEAAMAACWCIESGAPEEEWPSLIASVAFAEALMEGQ